ncbi:ATP-binding protein [Humisphaera borealis]|uniref:histidine kinase n=1 Tax=Humisphaera borealis TaxID=2807512 RepID=A0A7M2X0F5_9BACT|nr:ATP-binding protein [Humisphaera borealis]QOV91246.1 PAS domain S-box protein [Humisphaera borealis]
MPTFILDNNLDILTFAVLVLAASGSVHVYLRRNAGGAGLKIRAWLILCLLVTLGSLLAVLAGENERERLRQQVEGFAPTYALELARGNHASITTKTPADDPTYLALVECEKRWQAVNPAISDIYTFRQTADGGIALIVDSETDYDRNGRFEGDREGRTDIGEKVDGDLDKWKQALKGENVFDGVPYTDRWGTWVSAYVPLRDAQGNIEGGVGVDFDARKWSLSILTRRLGVLAFVAVAVVILVWSGKIISIAGVEIRRRRAVEQSLRDSEGRLRTILDNEPEAVLVTDEQGRILEINPSGIAALEVNDRTSDTFDITTFVAVESASAVATWIKGIATGKPGRLMFRINGLRGSQRWLDAHGVPLPGDEHRPATVLLVARDVTTQRAVEAEREKLQQQLVDASRQAGMAEIANGVIHNVGNVLNSVNVGTHVIEDRLRRSRISNLLKAVGMLREHRENLADFLANDERGQKLPDYLEKLAVSMSHEQEQMLAELRNVSDGVEHIKAIVNAQQSHAGKRNVDELLRPSAVLEDAIKMNIASCERHLVDVRREFEDLPATLIDKHKVMQILINLISNAKNAVKECDREAKQLTIRVRRGEKEGQPTIRFEVQDNGHGIAAEVMPKLFSMGFTTRKDGHGFGLHAAANLAGEMGGSLTAASDGPDQGATFVLEIPARSELARRAA